MSEEPKKIKHGIPPWLLKIPAGYMSISEMLLYTEESYQNVYMRMQLLKVDYKKQVHEGRMVNVYAWPGAEYYLKKDLKERVNVYRKKGQEGL